MRLGIWGWIWAILIVMANLILQSPIMPISLRACISIGENLDLLTLLIPPKSHRVPWHTFLGEPVSLTSITMVFLIFLLQAATFILMWILSQKMLSTAN